MTDNPLLLLLMIGAAGYLGKLWWSDLRQARAGAPNPQALPGAVSATARAFVIAAASASASSAAHSRTSSTTMGALADDVRASNTV